MTAPATAAPLTLILCPTALECKHLEAQGALSSERTHVAVCGFGPILSAARTSSLIAELRPAHVVLAGIAGTYDVAAAQLGTAQEFDEVVVDGVGVGEGANFLSPAEVGFPQWAGIGAQRTTPIVDTLSLDTMRDANTQPRVLLTTCAASSDRAHASQRRARFPSAMAEDMEGFGVAAACALAGVPLRIVRGISNVVGDRAVASWCIAPALAAVRARLVELLETNSGWRTK